MQNPNQKTKKIPASFARFLQEYDFDQIDPELHAIPIIERTLEVGTWEELHWLFHHYGIERITAYLQRFGHRRLSKMAFNYWRKLLQIKDYQPAPFAEIRDDVWRNH